MFKQNDRLNNALKSLNESTKIELIFGINEAKNDEKYLQNV